MRAAIYARVRSDGHDHSEALQRQVMEAEDECAQRGWEIVRRYSDMSTGAAADESSFGALLVDIVERRFDVLVVHSLDRLVRRAEDMDALRTALTGAGCALHLVGGGTIGPESLT